MNIFWVILMFSILIFLTIIGPISINLSLFSNFKSLFLFSMKFDHNLILLFLVLSISLLIYIYSFYYMETSASLMFFYLMLFMFVVSMSFLIISNSNFLLFLGWDGLGVTSYFLVIFYLNWKSNNSGMMTILSNRLGDSFFMMFFLFLLMSSSNSFMIISLKKIMTIFCIFIIIMAFTKSAQFPFSVWLPMAMAAPTPVSALVHSSTLVTAGVFLLLQFFGFLKNDFLGTMILIFSVLTLIHSGSFSLVEMDLKKVVALSTLNQLSFMLLTMSLGFKFLTFFHLSSHAVFKSLIFLSVGVLIHLCFSSQNMRMIMLDGTKSFGITLFMSGFSLMGLSFTSGFYSKDFILETFLFSYKSVFILLLVLFCMMFTFIYMMRLMVSMVSKTPMNMMLCLTPFSLTPSFIVLGVSSFIFGKWFFSNFLYKKMLNMNFSLPKIFLMILLSLSLMMILVGLKKNFFLKNYVESMFYLVNYAVWFNNLKMMKSYFFLFLEKSWLEILPFKFNLNYLENTPSFFTMKSYQMMFFIFLFFSILILF